MDLFVVIALLVIVSAIFSYLNARFIKLPGTIGIVLLATITSITILIVDRIDSSIADYLGTLAKNINFSKAVLNVLLGFLLFSSSFNLDGRKLKREMRPVFVLSTLGVVISTAVFGCLLFYVAPFFHIHMPLIYCLLFGALISPTDPVAVAAIIRNSKLPANLETIISGESLFNDGIGLILFVIILEVARVGEEKIELAKVVALIVKEIIGGIVAGGILGYLAHRLMRSVKDFQTIVLISLALVMGLSVLAVLLDFSIPLSVVTAGLFAGSQSINQDNKERSHEALEKFWKLVDEILNTILFVMIGLQLVNLPFVNNYWVTGSLSIVTVLIARWLSIMLPLTFLRHTLKVNYSNINIMTWAGLRGAISIALALSLPNTPYRHLILSGSYFIVIFSVIVQGLTLNRMINSASKKIEE
ncbi:sodium:proton antiporter [Mucilaginibacter rubeus]|uniref:Sodium:proton antiporter n=1 Tax=Mucilaginibacter rubeus TaxID=2027860 RepID=A0AAE6JCZ5_9SPHI|nr:MULTISPECIES: sodium:proton antiporter [Mucilaginibacter]QEM03328.1 sodium:proton antiporter [Mucilaginibacter rubeus]QEM15946.1 sodium:proton antiporter [Mucilaginibacter gossypii]QTE41310.1 sodium:proton antiporter [Mucilaginibacter rubeus]QTE47914.1 sodium:proton antiporter [Mucilaginibacter rubeus]QTE59307.1 sodium:proton antiporter [Mucilaginibacter rubeus]